MAPKRAPAKRLAASKEAENPSQSNETGDILDTIGITRKSPTALSLLNAVESPFTASRIMREDVLSSSSNPRSSSKMADSAKYWHNSSGDILVLRIPCLVDIGVPGVRIGKTLDLFGDKLDDGKFKKLRAAFGFRSLPADKDSYPPQVLRPANQAQHLLCALQAQCENTKRQSDAKAPKLTGFFRADAASDCFQYLVRTDPIFTPASDPSCSTSIPLIDLTSDGESDSGEGEGSSAFSSPSKLRAQVAAKASLSQQDHHASATQSGVYALRDWVPATDSTSPYYQFVGSRKYLWDSQFNIPDIRDRSGVLIQPQHWGFNLGHLTPVTVDVVLKLWEIQSTPSRVYQLVLRKIQIHPSNAFSLNIEQPSTPLKGKKRAISESETDSDGADQPSPSKKSKATSKLGNEDISML